MNDPQNRSETPEPHENIEDFAPFHSLETPEVIGSTVNLRYVEDEIFEHFYPDLNTRDPQFIDWSCRQNLDEIILPLGLTGAITDVEITWINNPLESLLSTKERGNMFFSKAPTFSEKRAKKFIESEIIGMEISGRTESKTPGMSVPVSFEAYYMQAPNRHDKAGNIDNSNKRSNDFGGIIRFVTRPTQQIKYFEMMTRRSTKNLIGTAGLKSALHSKK